jgi:hypothetical protein
MKRRRTAFPHGNVLLVHDTHNVLCSYQLLLMLFQIPVERVLFYGNRLSSSPLPPTFSIALTAPCKVRMGGRHQKIAIPTPAHEVLCLQYRDPTQRSVESRVRGRVYQSRRRSKNYAARRYDMGAHAQSNAQESHDGSDLEPGGRYDEMSSK